MLPCVCSSLSLSLSLSQLLKFLVLSASFLEGTGRSWLQWAICRNLRMRELAFRWGTLSRDGGREEKKERREDSCCLFQAHILALTFYKAVSDISEELVRFLRVYTADNNEWLWPLQHFGKCWCESPHCHCVLHQCHSELWAWWGECHSFLQTLDSVNKLNMLRRLWFCLPTGRCVCFSAALATLSFTL